MRLGILGGSFDPLHYGHLLLAEVCREEARLDEVWLMPTATSPHKPAGSSASAEQRMEMVQLAIAGHPQLVASRLEIDRGGTSYTVETLGQVAAEMQDAELFLLMGADTLHDLPNWREPARICQLATLLVTQRQGSQDPRFDLLEEIVSADRLATIRQSAITLPQLEISSSELRRRAASGQSLRYRTPRAVEEYIHNAGIYRETE